MSGPGPSPRTVIRGGRVLDGSGADGFDADVALENGRITEIGPNLRLRDSDAIDASGAVVAPGFIDSHTHFDASLFWDPRCDPMIEHGVTTVLIGNCSLGLAPLGARDRLALSDAFSFIEDLPREVFTSEVPWEWENFPDYAAAMRRRPLGLNVAALVGHSPLRMYVLGEQAWERAATSDEIAAIAAELEKSLQAGAFGLSSSMFDRDANGRSVPSVFAEDEEWNRLLATLGRARGVFEFIPRFPDFDGACNDIERLGSLAGREGAVTLWNGLIDLSYDDAYAGKLLELNQRLTAGGAAIHPMFSPRPLELGINFDQTLAFMLQPAWNEAIQTHDDAKQGALRDPDWRRRAREEWDSVPLTIFPIHEPERVRVTSVGRPDLRSFVGKSFAEVLAARPGHPSDVLADWLLENGPDAAMVMAVGNTDAQRVADLLSDADTLVSGSDAGAHYQMFCGAGDTTLFLTRHGLERGDLGLPAAVRELTGRQADVLGLRDRGYLRPGAMADVVVFDPEELSWDREVVTTDVPGGHPRFRRPPGHYRYTLVGGYVAQEADQPTEMLAGRFLGPSDRR